ncbi:MAG: hypothetical protein PHD95_00910 [Candidatus ainarchaeum sp.]|nr:hypothetical protein [Candidatus ainarchaeum sp.]
MKPFAPRKQPQAERKTPGQKRSPERTTVVAKRKSASFAQRSAEARAERRKSKATGLKFDRAGFLTGSLKGKPARRLLAFQGRFYASSTPGQPVNIKARLQRKKIIDEFLRTALGRELKNFILIELRARHRGLADSEKLRTELNKWKKILESALAEDPSYFRPEIIAVLKFNRKLFDRNSFERAASAEYAIRLLNSIITSPSKR